MTGVPAGRCGTFGATLLLLLAWRAAAGAGPIVDMHLHYKWTQQDVTSAAEALRLLDAEGIVMGVVIGTPPELALELSARAPDRIVAMYGPYQTSSDWYRWSFDRTLVPRARAALMSGDYAAIGELHLIGGFAPAYAKADVLKGLMALAAEFDVPIMLHTEYSRPDVLLRLCADFPDTRILWAHAGGILQPDQVARVMDACGNLSIGLAARGPWRFVNHPIADENDVLLPAWRELLLRFPDRVMLGSDPVWPVEQLDAWDRADTGWQELGRFWSFHRALLAQLPEDVARRIGCANAVRLFGREDRVGCR